MLFRDLETPRLMLKTISSQDREFMLRQFSNNGVNQYLFDTEPLGSLEEADELIAFYMQPEPRSQQRWILIRKQDGAKIGTCGFHCWNTEAGHCEAGYDLDPDYWGQGYMREAMEAILAFARNDMKVKRVHACIYPRNERSVALAEKLGFHFSGETKDEIFRGKAYEHRVYVLDFPA